MTTDLVSPLRNRLEHEPFDLFSKIGEQGETIAVFRRKKGGFERDISHLHLCGQSQIGIIDRLECDATTAAATSAARAESQAACARLTSKQDLLLELMHRVKSMLREMRETLDADDMLIANSCTSVVRESLQADRAEELSRLESADIGSL